MKKKKTKLTKLNLGCGHKYDNNYINCDINTNIKADFHFDMEDNPWPFEDNSINEIKASHCLEHLSLKGYFNAFKEMYRICIDKALIEIYYPHHFDRDFYSDPTHQTAITLDGLGLFNKEFNKQCIKLGLANSTFGLDYDINFEVKEWVVYTRDDIMQKILPRPITDYTPIEIVELSNIFPGIIQYLKVILLCIKT